ncbi:MAG: DUF423 domain-containing protein [Marinoscillum sp.]|uniref:DUF423 domain-containing protein n=1 Tax=Marinoscillum sp. TaxID=2024838 RepID=UPI0032FB3262
MDKKHLLTGSVLAVTAVGLGAFGAHALSATLEAFGRKDTYDTAVQYHMFHAIAILFVSLINKNGPHQLLTWAIRLFLFGTLIFSGSLYVLCMTNLSILGAITPIGGLLFIGGWITLIIYALRH